MGQTAEAEIVGTMEEISGKTNAISTDVVIPAGVKSIGVSAFAECKSLKAISVPESVGTLGAGAFKGMHGSFHCCYTGCRAGGAG